MKFCDERIQKHLLNGGKIKRSLGSCNIFAYIGENGFIFDNSKNFYSFCEQDLTADDWKIVEPEYNWNKIIKDKVLCVFSDNKDFKIYVISPLIRFEEYDNYPFKIKDNTYLYCKPFNPADYNNIAKDLKEYEI